MFTTLRTLSFNEFNVNFTTKFSENMRIITTIWLIRVVFMIITKYACTVFL